MADNNVISYKKIKRNTQKIRIADFLFQFGSEPNKSPKIAKKKRSLNRYFVNFFIGLVYSIFRMVPGETLCPVGSEYVSQRGVECVLSRVTGG